MVTAHGILIDLDEEPSRTLQRIELPAVSVEIEQHDSQAQWCEHCQRTFVPEFPEDLRKAGLVGPRLTALVGFLKGACHMSLSAIRKYFRDVIGVRVSRGMQQKLVYKVSDALADPYEALLTMLTGVSRLNVDDRHTTTPRFSKDTIATKLREEPYWFSRDFCGWFRLRRARPDGTMTDQLHQDRDFSSLPPTPTQAA